MQVAQHLANRRRHWEALESLCDELERRRGTPARAAQGIQFASLYRAACADLALAEAYCLPLDTVQYLHQLVGRAHNQLYRSRGFRLWRWGYELLVAVPQRLFQDNALRLAFVVFWVLFLASAISAYRSSRYAEQTLGPLGISNLETSFEQPLGDRDPGERASMVGFYIRHNAGIGLQCFAFGLLGGIGGLVILVSNALGLGAAFGHMANHAGRDNFFEFVTAHGPFELTAIVLSAAAGMRLGFAMIDTRGFTRRAAVRIAGREAMPIMGTAIVLFVLAALIEGFLSPSAAPYWIKALVAVVSSSLLVFYFVMLGQLPLDSTEVGD